MVSEIEIAKGTRLINCRILSSLLKSQLSRTKKLLELEVDSLKKSFNSQQRAMESMVLHLKGLTIEMQKMNQSRSGKNSQSGNNSNGEHKMEMNNAATHSRFVRIKFPSFNGKDPSSWLYKVN